MNLPEYQQLAKRTQCPQPEISKGQSLADSRAYGPVWFPWEHSALLHAAIGIGGESGEINACIQRYFWYNKELDRTNLREEIGDLSWYIAEACNALGFSWEEILAENIAKLKARYPEKYSDYNAAEENRDRAKEQAEAVKQSILPLKDRSPIPPNLSWEYTSFGFQIPFKAQDLKQETTDRILELFSLGARNIYMTCAGRTLGRYCRDVHDQIQYVPQDHRTINRQ